MNEEKDSQKNDSVDIHKMAEDLSEIKSLLIDVDERSLVETWAFFTWSAFVFIGTAVHYVLYFHYGVPLTDLLMKMWLPVIICSICLETVAWYRKMSKESLQLFSRIAVRLWMSVSGGFIVMCLIIYFMIKTGALQYLPVTLQLLFATIIFYYAQISNIHMYITGFFLIVSGVIIFLLNLPPGIQFVVMGIVVGSAMIYAGVSTMITEKKKYDQ